LAGLRTEDRAGRDRAHADVSEELTSVHRISPGGRR
jgi:hypothetical protein